MPRDYSLREMHGGGSFPSIGEGAVLGTGVGGIVQPVDIQLSRHLRLRQQVPAELWDFDHEIGRIPVVAVLNEAQQVITDSVNYTVNEISVQVWTEGVPLSGYIDLFWFGPTGMGTGEGEEPPPTTPTQPVTSIDGGLF